MSEESKELAALINIIEDQERTLRFGRFAADDAFAIGSEIRSQFLQKKLGGEFHNRGIVISIATMTGHTLFACACGDESAVGPGNWEWVEGKTNIVKKHNHSSYLIGRKAVHAGKQPEPFSHGGAFPVWIEGSPVAPLAVIVVSGLQQHDDHQLVVDAIRDHIQKKKK